VKRALQDHELGPEATVEHGSVKDLIAQLRSGSRLASLYDAKIKVMSEFG